MAERELRRYLAGSPHDAYALGLLALCMAEQKNLIEAYALAMLTVAEGPDRSFSHYVMAIVQEERRRFDLAWKAIAEAIRLDPEDAGQRCVAARLRLHEERWQDALHEADLGLQVDPVHRGCLIARMTALRQLRRIPEAAKTAEVAIEHYPDEAFAHNLVGASRLEQNRRLSAERHFLESLRIDPTLDAARAGLVDTLNSRYVVYRFALRFLLWTASLRWKGQTFLVILAIGVLVLLGRLDPASSASAIIRPLAAGFALFLMACGMQLEWLANAVFNSLLRLDPRGRHALTDAQVLESNLLLGATGLAVVFAILYGIVSLFSA